ncbi:hypothetical protein K2X33_04310 [bacterium]|nr:hypothetical protein [bacterium]
MKFLKSSLLVLLVPAAAMAQGTGLLPCFLIVSTIVFGGGSVIDKWEKDAGNRLAVSQREDDLKDYQTRARYAVRFKDTDTARVEFERWLTQAVEGEQPSLAGMPYTQAFEKMNELMRDGRMLHRILEKASKAEGEVRVTSATVPRTFHMDANLREQTVVWTVTVEGVPLGEIQTSTLIRGTAHYQSGFPMLQPVREVFVPAQDDALLMIQSVKLAKP